MLKNIQFPYLVFCTLHFVFADSEFNEFAEVSSSAAVAVRPEVDEGATSTTMTMTMMMTSGRRLAHTIRR